jgi:hypothetical protein
MPLAPEWPLLLVCLHAPLGRDECRCLPQALAAADVEGLLAWVSRQGLAPLLYDRLQRLDLIDALPPSITTTLQRLYYANAVRNDLLYRELHGALRALQDAGITPIILKGAALAETVYAQRALRPMSDTDILIRPEAVDRAAAILADLGYTRPGPPQADAWRQADRYHIVLTKPSPAFNEWHLELHWHLDRPSRPFAIDLEGLWARARPVRIANTHALVLSPEDLLLHVCLHTCKHQFTFFGLRACCDIAATVRHYGATLDWAQVTQRAGQWQVAPYVYLPLRLAQELIGAAVPEAVLDGLRPEGFDARTLEWAGAEIFEDTTASPLFPELLKLWCGRWRVEKAAVVRRIFSPAVIARAYALAPTSKWVYLYYPVRATALVQRYGSVCWRLLRRDTHLHASVHRKTYLAAWLGPLSKGHLKQGWFSKGALHWTSRYTQGCAARKNYFKNGPFCSAFGLGRPQHPPCSCSRVTIRNHHLNQNQTHTRSHHS